MNDLANSVTNLIKSRFDLTDIDIYLSSIEDEWEIQNESCIIYIPEIKLTSLEYDTGKRIVKNGKSHIIRGLYLRYDLFTDECFVMRRVFSKEEVEAKYIHSHVAKSSFSYNWIEYTSPHLCFGDVPFSLIGAVGEKIVYFYNHVKLMFSHEHDEDVTSYPKLRHIEASNISIFYEKRNFVKDYITLLNLDNLKYQVKYNVIDGFKFILDKDNIIELLEECKVLHHAKVLVFGNKYYNDIEEVVTTEIDTRQYSRFRFKNEVIKVIIEKGDIDKSELTYIYHPKFIDSTFYEITQYIDAKSKQFNKNFSKKIFKELTNPTNG